MRILLILFIFLFNYTTYTQTAKEYYNSGLEKHQNGDYYGAIADYTKAIELNPEFAEPYYYRGLIYLQVLLPEKSCVDIKKAVDLGYQPAIKQHNKYCTK